MMQDAFYEDIYSGTGSTGTDDGPVTWDSEEEYKVKVTYSITGCKSTSPQYEERDRKRRRLDGDSNSEVCIWQGIGLLTQEITNLIEVGQGQPLALALDVANNS